MLSVRDVAHKYEKTADLELITLNDEQVKRVQEICLGIFKDIQTVCNKYGLKVLLGGGSALGAVRHKGFIPWDDDIDLMMPREDFNTFMQVFNKELSEKYYMACPHAQYSNQYNYIIKVIDKDSLCCDMFEKSRLFHQGFAIDIGAIDYVPDNNIPYYLKGWVSFVLLFIINSNMMYHCQNAFSKKLFTQKLASSLYYYLRISLGFFTSFLPYQKWCHIFDNFIASSKPTKRASIPSGRNHYFKETKSSDVFFPIKEAMFEDTCAYVPNDTDKYLKGLYGDHYMVIPPENKREKHICTKLKLD